MAIDPSLIDLFLAELELCKVTPGESLVILSDPERKWAHLDEYVEAVTVAGQQLGARVLEIRLPRNKAGRPDRKFAADAVGHTPLDGFAVAVDALKQADIVIDLFLLLHSPEQLDILAAGTRMLLVHEPPEVLRRMFPTEELRQRVEDACDRLSRARSMRITSEAGTDVVFELGQYTRYTAEYGYVDEPGRWDHMSSGMVAAYANDGGANGRIVLDHGDMLFPFKRYVESPIELTVADGFITRIEGDFDALLMREYMESWNDPDAFGFSHLGWGLNDRASWSSMATMDMQNAVGMDQRCFAGNVMISTGPNIDGGGTRNTPCHLDIPMRACSLLLDGTPVVEHGTLVH